MLNRRIGTVVLMVLLLLVMAACKKEEPVTEPETEAVTEAVTEPVTEAATEPETEPEVVASHMFSERYPYAVMIDNQPDALPQASLQKADIIYEMIVEGRLTRLMVVTDEPKDIVGPIRSARPAFVNFVLENQAFYAHVGNYDYVLETPGGGSVKDMDQFQHAGNAYYRASHKVPPHNMYADLSEFYKAAENEGYRIAVEEPYGYMRNNVVVPRTGGEVATEVSLTYDGYLHQRYEYDAEKGGYVKFINNEAVIDENTKEPIVIQSYILMQLEHWLRPNGVHYAIGDVGEGTAWMYEGGERYEIGWSREDNGEPMKLTLGGEELVLNPGLTYIQILPDWLSYE